MSRPDLKPCPFCGSEAGYDTDTRREDVYCGRCGSYGCRDSLHFNIAIAGCTHCSQSFREEFDEDSKETTMEQAQARLGARWNMRGRLCDECYATYEPVADPQLVASMELGSAERYCPKCQPSFYAQVERDRARPPEGAADWINRLTNEEVAMNTPDRAALLKTISDLRERLRESEGCYACRSVSPSDRSPHTCGPGEWFDGHWIPKREPEVTAPGASSP